MSDEELKQMKEEVKQLSIEANANIYIIEKMLIETRGMGENTITVYPLEGLAIKNLINSYKKLEIELKTILNLIEIDTNDK